MQKVKVTVDTETVLREPVERALRSAGIPHSDLAVTSDRANEREGAASFFTLRPREKLAPSGLDYVEAVVAVIADEITLPPPDQRRRLTPQREALWHTGRILYEHQQEASGVKFMSLVEFEQHCASPAR